MSLFYVHMTMHVAVPVEAETESDAIVAVDAMTIAEMVAADDDPALYLTAVECEEDPGDLEEAEPEDTLDYVRAAIDRCAEEINAPTVARYYLQAEAFDAAMGDVIGGRPGDD